MKKLITALLLTISFSGKALATVDAPTFVHLVVGHIHELDQFEVVTMYTEACYGIEYGPQSVAFTAPFEVTAGMGCGMGGSPQDINALSCADAEYKWNEEYTKVERVTIDLAKCDSEKKAAPQFKPAIAKAAKMNFGQAVEVVIK